MDDCTVLADVVSSDGLTISVYLRTIFLRHHIKYKTPTKLRPLKARCSGFFANIGVGCKQVKHPARMIAQSRCYVAFRLQCCEFLLVAEVFLGRHIK